MAGGGIRCSVGSCKSQQGKNKELSFFSFPKDLQIQKEWINRCHRSDKINAANARICSLHFLPSDFERNLKAELLNIPCRKRLKFHVIPSLLLKCDDIKPNVSSREKRILKNKRKEIVTMALQEKTATSSYEACNFKEESHLSIPLTEEQKIIDDLRDDIDSLKNENFDLTIKLDNIYLEKDNLVKQYQSQLLKGATDASNPNNRSFDNKVKELFSKQFTQNQLDIIMKKKRVVRWTSQELAHALYLRYFSRKGYVYLRETLNYPLPGISTLQSWAGSVNIRKGLLHEMLSFMFVMGESLSILEKVTILSLDEVKVNSLYEYDPKEDEVIGPFSYMQVVMARGLFSKWKQPVYIHFDTKMTSNILNLIITELHNINFKVVAVVSDCGGANIGLWRELKITPENVSFPHPVTTKNIYMFADIPHLLILIRNWLLDKGFVLENGKIISKLPLEALIQKTDSGINSCHRLKSVHITCKRNQRQNVLLATQVLSHTTATALKIHKPGPDAELAINLSEFIDLFNSWFDIMNTCTIETNLQKKPYMNTTEQDSILDKVVHTAKTMKCTGKNTMQTFQKGICVSTTSVKHLFEDLKNEFDIKYLLTSRLNQDVLKHLFSQIGSRGDAHDHPSPLNALYRIRMILLEKGCPISKCVNTNSLEETEFVFASVLRTAEIAVNVKCPTTQENEVSKDSDTASTCSSLTSVEQGKTPIQKFSESDGLKYIAGYIARKFLKERPDIGSWTKDINHQQVPSWLQYLSFGGLIEPSDSFFDLIKQLEKQFNKFHGGKIIRGGKNIVKRTALFLSKKCDIIDADLIHEFSRQRTFMRIKYLNLQPQGNPLKRKITPISSKAIKKFKPFVN